jgi:competence protein ComGC
MKLIELLTVIVIITILASIGVPAVVKAGKTIKHKWFEVNMWHGARLTAVLDDETSKSTLDYYLTNGSNPQKYYWNITATAN